MGSFPETLIDPNIVSFLSFDHAFFSCTQRIELLKTLINKWLCHAINPN